MHNVLFSLHPQWCSLILSGQKTIEVRTSLPKFLTKGSLIYLGQTNSQGAIVGHCVCDDVIITSPSFAQDHLSTQTCLTPEQLQRYSHNRKVLFLIFLRDPFRYPRPRHCTAFGIDRLPQSFCYV